jgi:predicted 2-oxoglutarate/Fe(II)-dependent dioxygenase YbiX
MQPNIINSFISKELAKNINDYLRSKVTINPKGLLSVQLEPLEIKMYKDDKSEEMHKNLEFIINSIKDKFNFLSKKIEIDRVLYQVLQKGEGLGWHTDAYGGVDGYKENYYSALLYLNDDYEGGEIVFYDDNTGNKDNAVSYKPFLGTLIYFKGDEDYPHSVNDVLLGERANIILFFKLNF